MNEDNGVTIVIPALDEALAIAEVIHAVDKVMTSANITYELLIVDDGSTDNTAEVASEAGAHVIQHERNLGYGASLKTGIISAQYERIVITDADGTYPIEAIPGMLKELENADLVIGARISKNVHIPLVRKPAKWMLAKLAAYIAGEPIADLNSGLRAFRRSVVTPFFNILSDKFSFTTTQLLAMMCNNYKIVNVTIDYYARKGKSKIVPWDFVNFVTLVLRLSMLFRPLKVFVPVSFFCIALSLAKFLMDVVFSIQRAGGLNLSVLAQPTVSTTTLVLFLAGIQILLIGMMSDGLSRKLDQQAPLRMASHAIRDLRKRDSND